MEIIETFFAVATWVAIAIMAFAINRNLQFIERLVQAHQNQKKEIADLKQEVESLKNTAGRGSSGPVFLYLLSRHGILASSNLFPRLHFLRLLTNT